MEPNIPKQEPFRFVKPEQALIYQRLRRLVGPGPAAFYRDACWVVTTRPRLEAITNVVGHLLREVEDGLRKALYPIKDDSGEVAVAAKDLANGEKEVHRPDILAVLRGLGIPDDHPVATAWLSLAGRENPLALHKFAHKDSLDPPRPFDSEFQNVLDRVEAVLEMVLDRFEAKFAACFAALDVLLGKADPSKADMKMLKEFIPNTPVTMAYFFDRLNSHKWLSQLAKKGFFDHPPAVERDYEQDTAFFPQWPQSRYLARMAALDPDTVFSIVQAIPETENVYVHRDLLDAALAMPPSLAAIIATMAHAWLGSIGQHLVPEKAGELVAYLSAQGQVQAALDLASALLEIVPDPRATEADGEEPTLAHLPKPLPRIGNEWEYGQILRKYVTALADVAGEETLGLLCDKLEDANRLSRFGGADSGADDYSHIQIPAIEEDQSEGRADVRSHLVSAIRQTAERVILRHPNALRKVVGGLQARQRSIFRRLAIHLVRTFSEVDADLAGEHLTERALFDNHLVEHEYNLLLRDCFKGLSPSRQTIVLGWIEAGPDTKDWERWHEERTGVPPSDDLKRNLIFEWQRDYLARIRGALPLEWKTRFEEIVAAVGEPGQLDVPRRVVTEWVGESSPLSTQDLRSQRIEEIVSFLSSWQPTGGWGAPSRSGIGSELQAAVAAEPERFAAEANQFRALDPTYIRGVISGFGDAVKASRRFDWAGVLALCRWVVEQPRELPGGRRSDWHEDPDWSWARKQIAHLLSVGFEDGPAELSFELRAGAWAVLETLTDDPDPTLEYESQYGGDNMDPGSMSINTVRGEAMHAVMRYTLWCYRHLSREGGGYDRSQGFAAMPEVREVLERHLNAAHDPALTVRSVYGWWFPQIAFLDHEWAVVNVRRIFPTAMGTGTTAISLAAWEAFIVYTGRVYIDAFRVLREQYGFAVERVPSTVDGGRGMHNPHERLAEHLMVLYWQGEIGLDDEDTLIRRFFAMASVELRHHALDFVGRTMKGLAEVAPPEVIARLQTLWTWRLSEPASRNLTAHRDSELGAFGWWFASGQLDDGWAIENLRKALELVGWVEPDHLVVERLLEMAPLMPAPAVRSLALLCDGARDTWQIYHWREKARAILQVALQGTDDEARTLARALVNRLGARGLIEFRDLLSEE